MAKVAAVNVVECNEANIESLHSFSDDTAGKQEAEDLFKTCISENGDGVTEEEMEKYLEERYFEQGEYQVFLVHSSE